MHASMDAAAAAASCFTCVTCGSPADYVNFQSWGGQSGHRLEVMPQSKFSGASGCSDAAVSQGSACGTPTAGDVVMGESRDGCRPACRICVERLLVSFRREGHIRRRFRLEGPAEERSSPAHHQPQLLCGNQGPRDGTADVRASVCSPLTRRGPPPLAPLACLTLRFPFRIKEKFSYAFDDICLYSEVSHLLAHCTFRLTSRRFIQELFQDVQFMPVRPQTPPPPSPPLVFNVSHHVSWWSSDVRGGGGNPEETTKTCRRDPGPSCRILMPPPLPHPAAPQAKSLKGPPDAAERVLGPVAPGRGGQEA